MAKNSARFQVDSRLASLLSQEYSSTEKALKELVDNAWDADAELIEVSLPEPLTDAPIIISDDGTGMTADEVRAHYLNIAADRRVLRGNRTAGKKRLVKGRKGVGKFAGLMAASEMALTASARGRTSRFELKLSELASVVDIEHLPIEIQTENCDSGLHGTKIVLSGLHAGLAFPDPQRFRQLLLQEYGRESGLLIKVNGKALGVDDVQGKYQDERLSVPGVGEVALRFAIADAKSVSRQPGIVVRVDGKAVGKPTFFGLDEKEDFPRKLLTRLYGEIDADGLREHVTAGWDSLIENSQLLNAVTDHVVPVVYEAFKQRYGQEMQLAQARLQRTVHDRLAALPEYRRQYAERAIKRVLDRYFGEPPEKIEPFVFVLLEAIERSDYGAVLEHLASAASKDVSAVAQALEEFGLAEMAYLVEQAKARQTFLDQMERLARDPKTLEAAMHQAIERSLWIFGPEYSLFSSNKTLRRIVEDQIGSLYTGDRATQRPDLLLTENLRGEYLLIEFKRPLHSLCRDDYDQATRYRHELKKHLNQPVRVLVVGGSRSPDFPMENREPDVDAATFLNVISTARRQVEWQLATDQ